MAEHEGADGQAGAAPTTRGRGWRGVRRESGRAVQSDAFEKAWVEGNRVAHKQLNGVLSGAGSESLRVQGDTVSVDLGPFVAMVKQKLVDSGLKVASAIPDVHPTFELFRSAELVKAQSAYKLLNALRWVLPVLTVALIALGVKLTRSHRRALIGAGLGLAGAMLALGIGLAVSRGVYLNVVRARPPGPADLTAP